MVSTTWAVAPRCCWVVSRTWPAASVTASSRTRLCCICLAPFSMAMTVAFVSPWTASTMAAMFAAEALDRSARRRTSSATTAKPRPPSPARAASIAALRASRLV